MKTKFLIAITTGDQDGIGLEVASKALYQLGPRSNAQFLLFRSRGASTKDFRWLDQRFQRKTFSDVQAALKTPLLKNQIYDIASPLPPPFWVEVAAKMAMTQRIHALVTGPLSKETIREAGLKDMGHTGLLKRVTGKKDLFMGFWGEKFSVVLATDHIPLQKVPQQLTKERLIQAIHAGVALEPLLKKPVRKKPVGLLGLNPHAGEKGILGQEELTLHNEVIEELGLSFPVAGPLVPDAAFREDQWKRYRYYVANYHDQGLIPFKMVHGALGGVHLTLGLPFLRTSVDHGTAKDIFGRNRADEKSMMASIKAALFLTQNRLNH